MTKVADVALIATVLNERNCIDDFLASIGAQTTLPAEFVVCDGGSSDGTLQALRAWEPPTGVCYTVLERPGSGIAAGRNEAIRATTAPWLAVSDAGAKPAPDWLANLVAALANGADVASGFFVPKGSHFMESLIARVITPRLDEIDPRAFLPSSRSVAFRREWWSSVGGYPEWLDYCEDVVFDLALRRAGAVFTFIPAALVTWTGRPSLPAFAKQYWRYARGDARANLWPKRHLARFSAYAVGVVGVTAGRGPVRVLLAAGFACYQAKFVRRVLASSSDFDAMIGLALLLSPIVVSVGDVAKMGGYLAGITGKARRRT